MTNPLKTIVGQWLMSGLKGGGVTYLEKNGSVLNTIKESGIYTSSELKRLEKQKAINYGSPSGSEDIWVKIGKSIFVICPPPIKEQLIAISAQIWWEYHHQLVPKTIEWSKNEE